MSLIEWIDLPNFGDERGSLVVIESNKNIPFDVKRLYYIYDAKPDIPRGFHAHKELKQIAFCLKGKCKMLMDNGIDKQEIWLDQPNKGLLIPPMIWHEMHDFSALNFALLERGFFSISSLVGIINFPTDLNGA